MNFITAVAYHFCPSLPAAFTQSGVLTYTFRLGRVCLQNFVIVSMLTMRSNILAHLSFAFCPTIAHPPLAVDGDIGGFMGWLKGLFNFSPLPKLIYCLKNSSCQRLLGGL